MAAEVQKNRGTLIDIAGLEDSVGTKGVNYDPEVLYTWTVKSVEVRKLKSDAGDGHEGKEFTVLDVQCEEADSEGLMRQSFFYNKKVRVNEDDKPHEDDAVKFARGIGYPVGVDMPFKWKEIFRPGIKFTAHVKKQINRKTQAETGYMELDLLAVQPAKGSKPAAKQASITGSDEDRGIIIEKALSVANKTALIGTLNKAGLSRLINLAIKMDGDGELSYKE